MRGQRGIFTRDEAGVVVGVDLAGRLFNRVATTSQSSCDDVRLRHRIRKHTAEKS